MMNRFDTLTPGRAAKLNLATDLCLVLFLVAVRDGQYYLASDTRPTALLLVAAITWLMLAAVLRLYSPCTPRGLFDDLLLGSLAVGGVTLMVGFTDPVIAPAGIF